MGLLDKLKGSGVLTAAEPEKGVEPASPEEVASRLRAISGTGIETVQDDDRAIVVSWGAEVSGAGATSARHRYVYRAIRVELDPEAREAKGLGLKTTTDAAIAGSPFTGSLGLSASGEWERGQHIGMETLHVVAWLGPHKTERGADEGGYTFKWSTLRQPVMEAVTGAGWTYKPKRV